jgi:hypothetical protein
MEEFLASLRLLQQQLQQQFQEKVAQQLQAQLDQRLKQQLQQHMEQQQKQKPASDLLLLSSSNGQASVPAAKEPKVHYPPAFHGSRDSLRGFINQIKLIIWQNR